MSKPSFFDNIREWIGEVAFAIYLWSQKMTMEEFWAKQDKEAAEHIRAADFASRSGGIFHGIGTHDSDPFAAQDKPQNR